MELKAAKSRTEPLRRRWKRGQGFGVWTSARLTVETFAAIDAHARANGIARSRAIEEALAEWASRQSEAA